MINFDDLYTALNQESLDDSIDLKICNYLKSRLKSELNHEIHQNQKQFHDIEDKISAWLINVINKQQKNIRHNVLEIILNLISIYGDENKQIEIELMNELTVVGSSLNLDKVILSLSNDITKVSDMLSKQLITCYNNSIPDKKPLTYRPIDLDTFKTKPKIKRETQMKISLLEDQKAMMKKHIKIMKITDIQEISCLIACWSISVNKLVNSFPSDLLITNLFTSDRTGFTDMGVKLVMLIRHAYEIICPILIRLLQNIISSHETLHFSDEDGYKRVTHNINVTIQRLLSSTKTILHIAYLYMTSSFSNSINPNSIKNSVRWTDVLSSLLRPNFDTKSVCQVSIPESLKADIDNFVGSLVADATKVYEYVIKTYLQLGLEIEKDSDRFHYLWSALKEPSGLLLPRNQKSSESKKSLDQSGLDSSSSISRVNTKVASEPLSSSEMNDMMSDALSILKSIFPDYGELFLVACLQTFDYNTERTIDAIISDNLPPQLAEIDRSISKAWKGKGGGGSKAVETGNHGRSGEVVFKLEEDTNMKKLLKEKILNERRDWEHDLRLIDQLYDDDYDDQYDEAIVYQSSSASVAMKSSESELDWDIRMQEMKRINQITKDDENEVQFWKSMRNTNRDYSLQNSGEEKSEDEKKEDISISKTPANNDLKNDGASVLQGTKKTATKSSQSNKNHLRDNNQKSRDGNQDKDNVNPTADTRKPRTKTFDKHHQKEKATRKMMRDNINT